MSDRTRKKFMRNMGDLIESPARPRYVQVEADGRIQADFPFPIRLKFFPPLIQSLVFIRNPLYVVDHQELYLNLPPLQFQS